MIADINSIFSEHISPRDTLIVGVSGGPDSVFLLHILARWAQQTSRIIVAHVNHGIRGKESDRDESFVRALAKKYGFPFESKSVSLAGKSGQEELGRSIRRDFFEKLREKYGACFILTAHTEDDQLETIVFNFLRGGGPAGLGGMRMREGCYFKPLLVTPKSEILKYLKAHRILFCRDRTNHDTRYRRNFIRKKILPLFSQVNPEFRKTIIRNSAIFREIQEWLDDEAKKFLGQRRSADTMQINAKDFSRLPQAVQNVVLQHMFQQFTGSHYRLSLVKIAEVRRLIKRNIGRKRVVLGRTGGEFVLEKGKVFFACRIKFAMLHS